METTYTIRAAVVVDVLAELALGTLGEAIPTPLAQQLCARLRKRGVDADWTPDHDDSDKAWVTISASERSAEVRAKMRGPDEHGIYRCKIHNYAHPYARCAQCGCQFCGQHWVQCPRC